MLRFESAWRFEPPPDGECRYSSIPSEAVDEFFSLILKVARQGPRQELLEHFKSHFCDAIGMTHVWSSNESWAETDLNRVMFDSANNAPLFIEAIYDAGATLKKNNANLVTIDAVMINKVLEKYDVGYEVVPPDLKIRHGKALLVEVVDRPQTLAEQAVEVFQASLRRSEELLSEGRGREAVQEILWLLESVSTAFRGLDTGTGTIGGKYFNKIAQELRQAKSGTSFDRIIYWLTTLHGYLSSPSGGGIRHGLDLDQGVAIDLNEARLYCNLVRSYLYFLLVEHERMING